MRKSRGVVWYLVRKSVAKYWLEEKPVQRAISVMGISGWARRSWAAWVRRHWLR